MASRHPVREEVKGQARPFVAFFSLRLDQFKVGGDARDTQQARALI